MRSRLTERVVTAIAAAVLFGGSLVFAGYAFGGGKSQGTVYASGDVGSPVPVVSPSVEPLPSPTSVFVVELPDTGTGSSR